jgi:hypothetical protein
MVYASFSVSGIDPGMLRIRTNDRALLKELEGAGGWDCRASNFGVQRLSLSAHRGFSEVLTHPREVAVHLICWKSEHKSGPHRLIVQLKRITLNLIRLLRQKC